MPVKGRFAPSPSGRMHLGNLFSFLLAWLSVRSQGGTLVLRIEDLDPVRCLPSHAWQLMDDLEWLGLTWDEGGGTASYWQSNRSHLYAAAFEKLAARGLTYPCFCSRIQRLNEAPHVHEVSPSCPCAALTAEEVAAHSLEKTPSYRLRVPHKTISFTDGLQGPYSQDLATGCGDFPIKRADGAWAYQLAVVVDDALMGVTEVVRGCDLLLSASQQLYIYRLLGHKAPAYRHLPLICNDQGLRLSKRDQAMSMEELRRKFTAEEIIGKLAGMARITDDGAPCSAKSLISLFDPQKLPRQQSLIV